MKWKDAESELEFLETSEEARSAGLRRIRRRHYTGPPDILPGALTLEKVRDELLNDKDFVEKLREKLAA